MCAIIPRVRNTKSLKNAAHYEVIVDEIVRQKSDIEEIWLILQCQCINLG